MTAAGAQPGPSGAIPAGTEPDRRSAIVDAALRLMGEQGAAGASMRQLAAACGLNVATLYHYFPSKADLLRALVDDRRYLDRLALDDPPLAAGASPTERLAALIVWVWDRTLAEEAVLRLLLGEGIRGEPGAATAAGELLRALEPTLVRWLDDHVPELGAAAPAAARVLRAESVAVAVEHLALGAPLESLDRRAAELAALLLPEA